MSYSRESIRKVAKVALTLNLRAVKKKAHFGHLPYLLMLSDASRLAKPEEFLSHLPRGAGVVLRDYEGRLPLAVGINHARSLALSCRERGLSLIIAGDVRTAIAAGANGLHLAEWKVIKGAGWERSLARKRGMIVTAACHSLGALRRAEELGVDAALLSPVLPTLSHPGEGALGPLRFSALLLKTNLPVYALGGIDANAAIRIKQSTAIGLAGISFVRGIL